MRHGPSREPAYSREPRNGALEVHRREVRSRPGRAILTLLSIVISVAAVVSVLVATTTTHQATQEMYEAVAGRAALEVVAEGGGIFDDSVVPLLEAVPGVKAAVPTVQASQQAAL